MVFRCGLIVTGRALRAALGSWFLVPDVNQVAWKACKARQRATPAKEAFALRDALRIRPPEGRHPAAPGAARVAGRERHR